LLLFSCQRASIETHSYRVPSKRKRVRQNASNYRKGKKNGRPFLGGRPLLETGILFQDGQVTSCTSKLTGLAVPFGAVLNWNICVTQFNRNSSSRDIQAFSTLFCTVHIASLHRSFDLAEEEGIQPSAFLADSRQFSGLVTLATRPLLHVQTFGAPPRNRTAHAEVATRPLATCCCGAWHPRGDSNTQSRVWNPLTSPSATGAYGAPSRIRTGTVLLLRRLSLPVGLWAHIGRLGRIRTDTEHGLSVLPLPNWATSLWCSGRDSNVYIPTNLA
jgi:hypothetical protein